MPTPPLVSRRFSLQLASLAAVILGSSAVAQQDLGQSATGPLTTRATSASKYAGVFHVATGTWTRRPQPFAVAGPDVIYSNTASAGYFTSAGVTGSFAPGSENFDEGGIPTTANTRPFPNVVNRDVYVVNGYQLNYCDFNVAGSGGWRISFFESYAPCTFNGVPTETIVTTQLPADGCWLLDIDLAGGQEFEIEGDGGDGFQNDPSLDTFGWSFTYAGSDGTAPAGMLIAGVPRDTDPGYITGLPTAGTGTYYGGPSACEPRSTGYITQDFWWLEDPTGVNSNCFFFGSNFFPACSGTGSSYHSISFYLRLFAEGGTSPPVGLDYCQSNPNSTGQTTLLEGSGSDVVADDNVFLRASRMTPGTIGYFVTSLTQGFVTNPAGSNGNLCLAGPIGRFLQTSGQIKMADANGAISLSTAIGEWTVTQIPTAMAPFSSPASVGSTNHFQLWHRDIGGSNFSNGLAITWR